MAYAGRPSVLMFDRKVQVVLRCKYLREQLQFDWDEANRRHIALHRVKPGEAEEVLANDPLEVEVVIRKGESRRVCIGQTDSRRLLTLVYTMRQNRIRIVTAYPSNRQQRELYESK